MHSKALYEIVDHLLSLLGVAVTEEHGVIEDVVQIIELESVLVTRREGPRFAVGRME